MQKTHHIISSQSRTTFGPVQEISDDTITMTIGGYNHHYHTWPATTKPERAHIRQSCSEEQYDNNIIDAAKISGGSQTPTIMPITQQ